ncbi:MAG: arsenate reductase (glutaredoxin) [Brevundimonas sp.]|uniref:arsenate reductase (glutaredoxin) n=1 Tax=Brevundimonas sp. TaxID=1871086 RepID=UPI00277A6A27|nr:arsenate reductase (glutaredoxin) [Brevundimonas sp.]MDP3400430.1 arsenate reductase (glutaredoxin) [Brevundimonas sp.]MDZ4110780.1 arsenate reductase (glutaredoxin) [Brevundimonas sp.]
MTVTVYHNPKCGTSRNVLDMVRASGVEPEVVEYLKTGWTADQLTDLATRTGEGLKGLLRERGTSAEERGLTAEDVSDAALLAAMVEDPVLVNRPIVITPKGAALCRPSERVLDLLDRPPSRFVKEDGEVVGG